MIDNFFPMTSPPPLETLIPPPKVEVLKPPLGCRFVESYFFQKYAVYRSQPTSLVAQEGTGSASPIDTTIMVRENREYNKN